MKPSKRKRRQRYYLAKRTMFIEKIFNETVVMSDDLRQAFGRIIRKKHFITPIMYQRTLAQP